ncbi:uncharacterized protein LOC116013122 [Ipomoea triloba]|uniref:uncharacterized protein LOC116013122 n=1 Tax=Ipomoea triloba TaxID=35885 RepID=UPI00125E3A9B|nr:uncharacterized protein LOC116013122 [Ipomoea triloba]
MPGYEPWRVTFFYGYDERNRRLQSWDLLRSLYSKSDLPWLVVGDFNDIATPSEKRGLHPHPTNLIDGFNLMLDDCGLFDLGMRGRRFTWERGRGSENWVEERLDRAVAGADWCTLFPQATVFNHDVITSDRTALFVEIEGPRVVRQRRKFMFENAWLKDAGCKEVVMGTWNNSAGDILPNRLLQCGVSLKRWGGSFVKQTEKEILSLQGRLNNLRDRRDVSALDLFRELDGKM